jgi:hypothetical protein
VNGALDAVARDVRLDEFGEIARLFRPADPRRGRAPSS